MVPLLAEVCDSPLNPRRDILFYSSYNDALFRFLCTTPSPTVDLLVGIVDAVHSLYCCSPSCAPAMECVFRISYPSSLCLLFLYDVVHETFFFPGYLCDLKRFRHALSLSGQSLTGLHYPPLYCSLAPGKICRIVNCPLPFSHFNCRSLTAFPHPLRPFNHVTKRRRPKAAPSHPTPPTHTNRPRQIDTNLRPLRIQYVCS